MARRSIKRKTEQIKQAIGRETSGDLFKAKSWIKRDFGTCLKTKECLTPGTLFLVPWKLVLWDKTNLIFLNTWKQKLSLRQRKTFSVENFITLKKQ